ncbi:MAG TPA: hemerythrin domain-containing protein [Trebonia sp.]|jgi:hypothetical protein|nr:hemerythrin domain-containing protein [Trebonia sp.]
MTDVFELLKKDHDEVKTMLARLEAGPRAADGATGEQLTRRKQLLDDVIITVTGHEAAEQQHFWPALRSLGPEGDRIADEAIEQETEAERLLDVLGKTEPEHPEFEEILTVFTSDARAHIAFEEAHTWPLLAASLDAGQASELGDQIAAAKKTGPTRPHPAVPPQGAVKKAVGPVAGAADRLRDMVTGRGHHKEGP